MMTNKLKPRMKLANSSLEARFLALGAASVLATASVGANATVETTQSNFEQNNFNVQSSFEQSNLEHALSRDSKKIVGADVDDAVIVAYSSYYY